MGMYDTLRFTCPACGERTSQQSKAGPCVLGEYELSDAPLPVIADIHQDGEREELYCEHCHKRLRLSVKLAASVQVAETGTSADEWREF